MNDLGEGQISAKFVFTERNLVSGKCGHETVFLTGVIPLLSSPLLSLRRGAKKRTLRTRLYGIIISATRKKEMERFNILIFAIAIPLGV